MSRSSASGAGSVDLLLDGFVAYLRSERGVSALTVEAYVSEVRRFLADRGGSDLCELTAAEVSKAVLGQVAGSVAGVGAPLRVRAALVSALLLSHRPGRARPVRRGVAGVGAATVAAAPRHHSDPSQGVAARLRSAPRQRPT